MHDEPLPQMVCIVLPSTAAAAGISMTLTQPESAASLPDDSTRPDPTRPDPT